MISFRPRAHSDREQVLVSSLAAFSTWSTIFCLVSDSATYSKELQGEFSSYTQGQVLATGLPAPNLPVPPASTRSTKVLGSTSG